MGFERVRVVDPYNLDQCDKVLKEELEKIYSRRYAHEDLRGLYTKTSVSELKMASLKEEGEEVFELFPENRLSPVIASFAAAAESGQDQGEETSGVVRSAFTGTEYGTAVHRLLELFDYGKFTDPASVTPAQFDSWRTELAASAKIPPSYAEQLPAYGIMSFLHSSLAGRMAAAFARGELYREQPFVLGIEADKVNPGFPKEETVLVQGIIDAYFEENGELVLVDYKTDAVEKAQDLIDRYRVQLDLYERALTQITGKNVKEKLIYSVSLKKTIPL